jgi:hypothetical protein
VSTVDRVPRRLRSFCEGIFHIGSHGSDTRHLFLTTDDRLDFLARLTTVLLRFDLGLLSYVLLGNHYHVLLRVRDARVSRALQHLHTEYSRWHNRRHRRSAHLFRAHAFANEIESGEQLLAAYRYLARNPVDANLVADPFAWPWGSARAHAGLEPAALPLAEDPLRAAFGDDPGWRSRYRDFVTGDPA